MSLINGSIPVGATFAPTGGTARTMLDLGGDLNSRKLLIDEGLAFSLRKTLQCSVVDSKASIVTVGNTQVTKYTGLKRRLSFKLPKQLSDLSYYVNQANIELLVHPETTVAEIANYLSLLGIAVSDIDFDAFFKSSSLA
jgi:hypothetical protein